MLVILLATPWKMWYNSQKQCCVLGYLHFTDEETQVLIVQSIDVFKSARAYSTSTWNVALRFQSPGLVDSALLPHTSWQLSAVYLLELKLILYFPGIPALFFSWFL